MTNVARPEFAKAHFGSAWQRRPTLKAPRACLCFPQYDLAWRGLAASGMQSNSGSSNAFRSQFVELATMADLDRIVRLKTVLARTGLSRSTLYRKISEGTFPRQVPISVHGAGWRESA